MIEKPARAAVVIPVKSREVIIEKKPAASLEERPPVTIAVAKKPATQVVAEKDPNQTIIVQHQPVPGVVVETQRPPIVVHNPVKIPLPLPESGVLVAPERQYRMHNHRFREHHPTSKLFQVENAEKEKSLLPYTISPPPNDQPPPKKMPRRRRAHYFLRSKHLSWFYRRDDPDMVVHKKLCDAKVSHQHTRRRRDRYRVYYWGAGRGTM